MPDKKLQALAHEHRQNAYLMGVDQVVANINSELPKGYRATFGFRLHNHTPDEIAKSAPTGAAVAEWAYCGQCRVVHGDAAWPIYIYKVR